MNKKYIVTRVLLRYENNKHRALHTNVETNDLDEVRLYFQEEYEADSVAMEWEELDEEENE